VLLLTLRGLRAHKRRLLSTVLAVLLGVSFMTGSRVLTDTMEASLAGVLVQSEEGTDVLVRGEAPFDSQYAQLHAPLPIALVDELAALPEVAAAVPRLEGYAQVVRPDGEPAVDLASGAVPVGQAWSHDADLNPFVVVDGRAPTADDEVVLDRRTARDTGLSVGDRTTLLSRVEPRPVVVVGVATFGEADSRAGTSTVLLPAETAAEVLTEPGTVGAVALRAADGRTQTQLADAVQGLVPTGAEAVTGEVLAAENAAETNGDVEFFSMFLTVFAVVSLLVGAFIIHNTFAILVAQRVRELALVRALGASRKQVRRSVALEALVVGATASTAGVASGIGVAAGLQQLLSAAGLPLPEGALVVHASSLLVAFGAGVVVTIVSALLPARRAAKVPPVAAMRDVVLGRTSTSGRRVVFGSVLTGGGAAAVVGGILAGAVPPVMLGALAVLLGVAVLAPVVVRPAVRVLGAWLPAARGVRGQLARDNAVRNPRRSAATASALMVGVSLVAAITCFVASGKQSVAGSFDDEFRGDLAIDTGAWMAGGLSADLTAAVETAPEVQAVAARRYAKALLDGSISELAAWSGDLPEVFDVEVEAGSLELGDDGIAVSGQLADDRGWALGDTVPVVFSGGEQRAMTVQALYARSDWIGPAFVDRSVFATAVPGALDTAVYVDLADGVDVASGRTALERLAEPYAGAAVRDRAELREASIAFFDTLLGIVYALLGLAVLIALLGIANTVSLSVVERTREIGMLRAVGAARSQVRSAVRWEAALISAFGGVVGLGVGLFLGWALVFAISQQVADASFVVPVGQLAVIGVVAAAAGVVAALLPARRAARLDVLGAVASA
jgi:putative ABC transport system permease protein